MALNILDFATIVRNQVTAMQGRATGLVDLAIGSLLRSVFEANAGVVQWIQQLIVNLLVTTRAATCTGSDLDTWMADYSFYRLSASQAAGIVTFSRFTATNQAFIPVGTVVTTTDGTQQYTVVADTTNPAYSAPLAGYTVAANIVSINVSVLASTAGSASNALAGTVTVITGGIQYIDTVSNGANFTGGADAETDDAFRARFVLWVSSLSKATKAAIGYALTSMQKGVSYTLTENQDYSGNVKNGYFYAVVDDGTGSPTSTFLSSAYNAIDAVRPFTVTFGVFAPIVVTANVVMTLTVDPSAVRSSVVTLVQAAVQSYINSLSLGQLLPYTQLAAIAYAASPYVLNVSAVTLNGTTTDLSATNKQVIKSSTITVN
ncbi:baseplate J/gp47 family protein [Acinetobacter sp. ANC 4641]|uniref:baseplate J/gp47 family protein n=1 Tax=Acinetobacter sp. ANC 4641 TaxID=2529847 RepID=UPI00103FCEEA|nr:baseplate J/gp47 family protein [Acinetobacter sp. ANC 4641]TCB11428.1 baseplate protein [Acinetobacter sp. ANC 4641]